ncbi:MAG: Crp/Fnr family transcriptional regulator [Anaerolineales bacterium]|nr:Crp/Fnr family transcriptional regulator [Anaerolineales bacterium]MDW8162013.1 Crp/Fnr family transcriptional regulator [Anaerolineales bacterium]
MRHVYSSLEQRLQVLSENPYFSMLPLSALRKLAAETELRSYEKDEVIFLEGEECAGLFILHRGRVKLSRFSLSGREIIIRVLNQGATFNEVPVLDKGPHAVNAIAIEESQLWVVSASPIRELLVQYPQMSEKIILNLAQNLRMFVELVNNLSFYQVIQRLAHYLLLLPADPASGKKVTKVTQIQLAAQLGTVREVLARALRDLEQTGAIRVSRGEIEVSNEAALRSWINPTTE